MNNLPRKPVRFVESNQDLLKSQEGGMAGQRLGGTDYSEAEQVSELSFGKPVNSYRTPVDRTRGNEMFRRYIDGRLDVEWAAHMVIDALHKFRDGVAPLTSQEKALLSILFPANLAFLADGIVDIVRTVNMRLLPGEAELLSNKVAHHIAEEIHWNAGHGSGLYPPTRSGTP